MIAVLMFGLGAILGSACLAMYFGVLWLKNGAWPSYTAIDGFCWLFSCAPDSWAYLPQDWLGVHKVLSWLSPPGAIFILGMAAIWAVTALDE